MTKKESAAKYYQKNKIKILEKNRVWFENNKEGRSASQRLWTKKNRERTKIYKKNYKLKNPEKYKELIKIYNNKHKESRAIWRLKRLYNLYPDDYKILLEKQNGLCAICGKLPENGRYKKLCVDHSHFTGNVRGLLCVFCNSALGLLRDDIKNLQSAINYLSLYAPI